MSSKMERLDVSTYARYTRLHAGDIAAGTIVGEERMSAGSFIPRGHKIATSEIRRGESITRYGQLIAVATHDIFPGQHVHTHNAGMTDAERPPAIGECVAPTIMISKNKCASFQGYRRENGRVGTRNYIGVIATVNCSSTVVRQIVDSASRSVQLQDRPNFDGLVPITHSTGCSMDDQGEGFAILQRVMRGYIQHPNFAAVLLVGLGCEVNQIGALLGSDKIDPSAIIEFLNIQAAGGTRAAITAGVEKIHSMLSMIDENQRSTIPASELTVALQCGGSDGYSGITANPALGIAVDTLARHGVPLF